MMKTNAETGIEIERKFLLKSLPGEISHLRGTEIKQGYLAHGETREIRVRIYGNRHFLTVKDGTGLKRREVEIPIDRAQFDALWPLTEGCRIEKTRSRLRHGDHTLEIDRYTGSLAPLVMAEVEFRSAGEAGLFRKPAYFGEEVTGKLEYHNAFLALHGLPHEPEYDYQIGALPYLIKGGQLHIVVITNSSQTKWIIPKGHPEPGMSRQDVALMECVEEAGVIGSFPAGVRAQCKMKDKRTLYLYPICVTTLLKKWPESGLRRREVLPIDKALKTINDKELVRCIRRLEQRLLNH